VSFAGFRGEAVRPAGLLLRHHGLHIELALGATTPVGRQDAAGLSDMFLEAALTTIVDLEDSIAAVDANDKVAAYDNWLSLMQGKLSVSVGRDGASAMRTLNAERAWRDPRGQPFSLRGRALLFVRNVGHLMSTSALRLADGSEAPEGILDALVTSLCALHDLRARDRATNSRTGSVYIVKPKGRGTPHLGKPRRLHRSRAPPHRVHQHRVSRSHRRRDSHLHAGRPHDRQDAHEIDTLAGRL
jgi:malate synthase